MINKQELKNFELKNFKPPSIELLNDYDNGGVITINEEELEENKEKIIDTLKNYKIGIDQIKATIGPTVTLYEIIPEAGVRISKIKNLEDDIAKVADVDWIMEVVVERLDIKQQVFEKLEKYRTPGTLITSNTSGIPIKFMNEGRSEDFQQHFAVTHFFNPPRYLKLFEVVPGPNCKQEVTDFLMMYGDKFLGKTSVLAKDTPAFIGNRIGIFGIMSLFHVVKEMDLTIEEVDKLTGPVI